MEDIVKALVNGIVLFGISLASCASDDDPSKDGTPGALEAPMLREVVPMEGALHVRWMNMQSDCDSVEAESMMEGAAFAFAFSVPGSVDNEMDDSATDDMMYTYRLRCKKGSAYSPYSNEMSANPHDVDGG
jgi:hypothetical protein